MDGVNTVFDLSVKEIINLKTGARIGYAEDVRIDVGTGRVLGLVVPGKARLFGLLGRESDVIVPWESIERIGQDVILTAFDCPVRETAPVKLWST